MDKDKLQELINENKSIYDIAKIYNKSYTSVKYWLNKHKLKTNFKSFKDENATTDEILNSVAKSRPQLYDLSHLDHSKWSSEQKESYSYILGFYLGDGCLANAKGRSYTIMLANQADFYVMNKELMNSLQIIFPSKKVAFYKRPASNCCDIKLTAINLGELFPHGKGTKHTRKIELTDWQWEIVFAYPQKFIKGLIQSDGCRFSPRFKECPTYIIYQFSNCSEDIHKILQNVSDRIGLSYTFRSAKRRIKDNHAQSYMTSFNKKKDVETLDSFIGPKC